MLLERGADVHARSELWGHNVLISAVISGTVRQIKQLLMHGADPLATDHEGESALDWAFRNDTSHAKQAVKILREHLEEKGVAVDYDQVEKNAKHTQYIEDLEVSSQQDCIAEDYVFSWNPHSAMEIADSGFMLACLIHPDPYEEGTLQGEVTLDQMIDLIPFRKGVIADGKPLPRIRCELCKAILKRAAKRIVMPAEEEQMIGEVAACVERLYHVVLERTNRCETAEEVRCVVSSEVQKELEEVLLADFVDLFSM